MKYEYKVIVLNEAGNSLRKDEIESPLNKWFVIGWEYVESFQQKISNGGSYSNYPAVSIILRKEKQTDPLN